MECHGKRTHGKNKRWWLSVQSSDVLYSLIPADEQHQSSPHQQNKGGSMAASISWSEGWKYKHKTFIHNILYI